MYKCLDCGNADKFYGIVKEQGNALIFQNINCCPINRTEPVKEFAGAVNESASPSPLLPEKEHAVKGNLWALQNNGKNDGLTWAYLISGGKWKGFHEVRSCAACHSTNIANI